MRRNAAAHSRKTYGYVARTSASAAPGSPKIQVPPPIRPPGPTAAISASAVT